MTGRLSRTAIAAALSCGALLGAAASASAKLPPIKHVFVLIDENESEATSFGPGSPAPYLAKTLVSQGAFLRNYYGVGHNSLDNYIAMVSGQAPNPMTSGDCPLFSNFTTSTLDASGQDTGEGCVYPANVPTLMAQLSARHLTWRAYEDSMGANSAREAATCGHPPVGALDTTQGETPTDQYATRHDPFVYFHSVIDNSALCNANVVNLSRLPGDLASAATTPNYVFITPSLCDDGHDSPCSNGQSGGLTQANTFLETWVPKITGSPAFKQNGLLIVTFDEAVGDDTACCGEKPGPYDAAHGIQPGGNGPGGGMVGAVLLSPFIKAGTLSTVPYNHYSMLGSVEDLFGLSRLAYAAGTTAFGADIFNRPPSLSGLKLKPSKWAFKHPGTRISYSDSVAGTTKFVLKRRSKKIATFKHSDVAGHNSFRFSGRVHGRKLAVGSYTITATPTAGSLVGKSKRAKLRVK